MRIGGIQCCVRFETDRGGSVGRGKRHPRHGFHSGPFGATTSVEKLFLQCRATRFPEICPRLWGSGLSICYTVFIIRATPPASPSRCGNRVVNVEFLMPIHPFPRILAKCQRDNVAAVIVNLLGHFSYSLLPVYCNFISAGFHLLFFIFIERSRRFAVDTFRGSREFEGGKKH